MTINSVLSYLPPYQDKKKMIIFDQSTGDIINEMLKAHKLYSKDYDAISEKFWKGNINDTCKYIFHFLKKNVTYNIEPDSHQSVKSPAAIIETAKNNGYNDCKHYSSFFGGIIDSLRRKGITKANWCYRFANYKAGQRTPHHVFVVVNPGANEIWCDAVLSRYNLKKRYINKIDKFMPLYSISGIGCCGNTDESFGVPQLSAVGSRRARIKTTMQQRARARYLALMRKKALMEQIRQSQPEVKPVSDEAQIDGIGRRKPRGARKAARKEKKAARQKGFCNGKLAKKIALAPARGAFLALVKLNFNKMGSKLFQTLKDPNKKARLFAKWCKLGGNARLLNQAILKVAKRKKLSGIGAAPAGIGPTLAAAAPIIQALLEFLPKILKKKTEEATQEVAESGSATAAAQQAEPVNEVAERNAGIQRRTATFTTELDDDGNKQLKVKDTETEETLDEKPKMAGGNTLLYLGAGAAALFLLTRKK